MFYLSGTLITDITSITKLKRLLSLANHFQMKPVHVGQRVVSAALSLTLVQNILSAKTVVF